MNFISLQNEIDDRGNVTIVIEDSDSESSCQIMNGGKTVEPKDKSLGKCPEAPDEADFNNVLCMGNTNNSTSVPYNVDDDAAFLTLIAKELSKMTPSSRQQFKRNVTQLLYS